MPNLTPTLEAVTVIRVPPPGIEPGYAVAVVRDGDGLHTVRLLFDGDEAPAVGTPLEEVDSPVPGVTAYRPVEG
jgi:hypothetical protein